MKTGNLILVFLLSCWLGIVEAQDYLINFIATGDGGTTEVSWVKIENLTKGTSLEMDGKYVLHLVNSTTGIEPVSQYQTGKIYFLPNPMTDYSRMQFDLPVAGMTVIELFDISGRHLLQKKDWLSTGRHIYKLQGIPQGTFVARIKSGKYAFAGKIVSTSSLVSHAQIDYENTASIINNVEDNIAPNAKIQGFSKSINEEVRMEYSPGDRLKLTGEINSHLTIVTDVPTSSKTITFNFLDCADGDWNYYPIVQIGTQTWMAENLRTTRYRDKLNFSYVSDNTAWSGLASSAYCWLDNDETTNKNKYGGLYNWYAVTTRRLCPVKWHIPSDAEWTTLTTVLGGQDIAGGKLKETRTSHWISPNTGATNETGFTSLPGGYRPGDFQKAGEAGYWWTATETSPSMAYYRSMENIGSGVSRSDAAKTCGYSVRCLRDNNIPPPGDWTFNTDFGTLVFTVDPSSTSITKMAYNFSNFQCGPIIFSGTVTITSTPAWQITDGYFLIVNKIDISGNQVMTVAGTYDSTTNKFSGTWSENSYGSICSGVWEASAP
jgi:uncharacterized protein (TIGR02145 family)